MPVRALSIDMCISKILTVQIIDKLMNFLPGDDPHNYFSIGNSFFNDHPNKNTGSKSGRVGNIADPIVHVLKYLPDSHKPDKRFKETQDGGRPSSSAKHVDNSNGIDRYVSNTRQKN